MATVGPKKSRNTSGASGANDMQAVASLAVLAKVHAEVRADINPDLLNAIREHEAANAAWLATSDGDLPTGTMEAKAADQAEKKLIHFSCHSHADVLAKRGGSVCLNSFLPISKWFPALFMPRGELSAAG